MTKFNIAKKLDGAQCVVIPVWEEKSFDNSVKQLDKDLGGLLSNMASAKDFESKKMQMSFSLTNDKKVPAVLLVGLGKQKDFGVRDWKKILGAVVIALQGKKLNKFSVLSVDAVAKKLGVKTFGMESVVAVETAGYAYDEHKSEKESRVKPITQVDFAGDLSASEKNNLQKGVEEGVVLGESVNYARHLGNIPPSIMTPSLLAQEAQKLGKENSKLKVKVLSLPEIKKLKMGCLLGVSQGSVEEPKFIIVEYFGSTSRQQPTVLAGKGITFDSGGLGIKPGNYMNDMKFDMLGAATVLGIMRAAVKLGLKKNLVGLIPSCENMPSGSSYRPDDILTAHNGKTVEIMHTDAEGRLILADALSYAVKYKPKEVIDFATLTGACMVALGNERSGVFSNKDGFADKLKSSSDKVGEQLWHLPVGEEYSEAIKSEVADVKNLGGVGGPGYGGASTAAAFLEFFTDYPWAHIDLSCSHYGGKGKAWIRGGANGFGVQTVIDYLR